MTLDREVNYVRTLRPYGRVASDHPRRPVGLHRSSCLGWKPQPHTDAIIGHMHVNQVGLAMRLCRDRRLISVIDRLRMRSEQVVVLVHLARLRRSESHILAEFRIVCLDSDHRGRQHLLTIHDNPIAKNAVGSAELGTCSSVRARDGDRTGSARLAESGATGATATASKTRMCCGLHHVFAFHSGFLQNPQCISTE